MKELLKLFGMLGITLSGFRLYWQEGYGAAIGGTVQGLGTALAGYWAAKQAAADRKAKTEMFNKENLLNINQFNLNQNRLAGLAGVFSGKAASNYNLAKEQYGLGPSATNFNADVYGQHLQDISGNSKADAANYNKWVGLTTGDNAVSDAALKDYASTLAEIEAKNSAQNSFEGTGNFTLVNPDKYTIGSSSTGPSNPLSGAKQLVSKSKDNNILSKSTGNIL